MQAGVLPVAIVGTAGTTNTGAIDPLADLADLAAETDVWFHVDGAYGLLAADRPRAGRPLRRRRAGRLGHHRPAQVAVRPHRHRRHVRPRRRTSCERAFTEGPADYLEGSFVDRPAESLFDDMGTPYADYGVELTSPARGVMVWAMLRELGLDGVQATVRRDLGFAQHLADRVRAEDRLELLTEPELSDRLLPLRPRDDRSEAELDDLNGRLLRTLRRDTPYAPSSTRVAGRYALRPCYVNPRTTLADVDGLADAVLQIGADLSG